MKGSTNRLSALIAALRADLVALLTDEGSSQADAERWVDQKLESLARHAAAEMVSERVELHAEMRRFVCKALGVNHNVTDAVLLEQLRPYTPGAGRAAAVLGPQKSDGASTITPTRFDCFDIPPAREWRSSSGEPFNPEFHMTCDGCGSPGMQEAEGWIMPLRNGPVFCSRCGKEAHASLSEWLAGRGAAVLGSPELLRRLLDELESIAQRLVAPVGLGYDGNPGRDVIDAIQTFKRAALSGSQEQIDGDMHTVRRDGDRVSVLESGNLHEVSRDRTQVGAALSGEPQSYPHRCSGCGLRWHTTMPGSVATELCGDCWRKVQPILHGAILDRRRNRSTAAKGQVHD